MANSYPLSYVSQNLQAMLSEFLKEYSEELYDRANKVTEQVAADFAGKLAERTPRSTKDDTHLADTVTVTPSQERSYGRETTAQIVHYGKWQIAHLLEFGYTLRNGEKLVRTPFIRPLFDENRDKYYQMYKDGLEK